MNEIEKAVDEWENDFEELTTLPDLLDLTERLNKVLKQNYIPKDILREKIKELDEKAYKHCFKQGKMCDECWERKKPLMDLLNEEAQG